MAAPTGKVKLVDIAREANVANSVVSSLFRGNYYGKSKGAVVGIGADTKKRIFKACRKLGYRPADPVLFMEVYPEQADVVFLLNKVAKGFDNNYYSWIIDGLGEEAEEKDVGLVLGFFESNIDYLSNTDLLPLAARSNPAGKFIIAGEPNYSLFLSIMQRGGRVVSVSRHIDIPGVVSLVPDFHAAAELAIQKLIESGHRNIAVFAEGYFKLHGQNYRELIRGTQDGLKALGQDFQESDIIITGLSPDEDVQATIRRLMDLPERPTAAFCFDDCTASVVLRHAHALGIHVPADLSVVGCNDEKVSASLVPGLTTVRLPLYEIGKAAFHSVTELAINGSDKLSPVKTWPVGWVERQSLRPLI